MRNETVVYRNRDLNILITDARVVVSNKTYALSNITSVEALVKPPNRLPGAIVAALGLAMILGPICFALNSSLTSNDMGYALLGALSGLALFALGVFLAYNAKTRYAVVVVTTVGEVEILSANDKEFIREIIAALNKAIAQKG